MGRRYDEIDDKLGSWLIAQPVFFVATAPVGDDGHVNVSPKGMAGTFAVLGPRRVGYLDYFASGVETIAHLRQNGRITFMFCAFDGRPRVVRLYGRGRAIRPDATEYPELRTRFAKPREKAVRAVIVADLDRIADSCGYAVPRMDFVADRDVLDLHQMRRDGAYYGAAAIERNAVSIDGLPALR